MTENENNKQYEMLYDDYVQIRKVLNSTLDFAGKANPMLAVIPFPEKSPLEKSILASLETLNKYAPEEHLIKEAIKSLKAHCSTDRAERVLIKEFGCDTGRAVIIVDKAWNKYLHNGDDQNE